MFDAVAFQKNRPDEMVMPDKYSFQDVQAQFSAHIRDPHEYPVPAGIENRRMAIYRDLIYKNVEGFIQGAFPVLRKVLSDSQWHLMVRDFIRSHECQTPYFLEISQEFLLYLQKTRRPLPEDPPFLLELAHYEWVELALDVSEEVLPCSSATAGDVLDEPLNLSPLAWYFIYQYPVHRIGPDYLPSTPADTPTCLIVYRNHQDQVKFLESNMVTLRLLSALENNPGILGREAISCLADEVRHPSIEKLLASGRSTLETLLELGIIYP